MTIKINKLKVAKNKNAPVGNVLQRIFSPIKACARNAIQHMNAPIAQRAPWANTSDISAINFSDKCNQIGGCVVGAIKTRFGTRPLIDHSNHHVLAVGPARSGKSVSLVIPTLLQWEEGAVIYDVSGEYWSTTAGWRQSLPRSRVIKFAPYDENVLCAKFNPLNEVRLYEGRAMADALEIAKILINPRDVFPGQKILDIATTLLQVILIHTAHLAASEQKTLQGAAIMLPNKAPRKLIKILAEASHPHAIEVRRLVLPIGNSSDDELSELVSIIANALFIFNDPKVAAATASSDFSINDLASVDLFTSLYLVPEPHNADRLSPIMNIILGMTVSRRIEMGAKKNKMLLLLEEFRAMGHLNFIEDALPALAGCGIKCYFVCHSIDTIRDVYGLSESISTLFGVRIILRPASLRDAEHWSGEAGTHNSTIAGLFATFADELLRFQTVRKINGKYCSGDVMVLAGGVNPIKGISHMYFTDTVYRDRADILAPGQSYRPDGEGAA
ncbi:type IV secretory system conjugative DNA transfer family protein [Janthinobacterium sp. CAN_S7]|uniref:type IV secretory system conjugative DNA transfer family protein n=1 Tax=Janthinobacterium sp. CAN_S7 TaxID=3071704 RepID=UPI00319E163F